MKIGTLSNSNIKTTLSEEIYSSNKHIHQPNFFQDCSKLSLRITNILNYPSTPELFQWWQTLFPEIEMIE